MIPNRTEISGLPLLNAKVKLWKSETPNRQQTECPVTNRMNCRGSSRKLGTQQPIPMMSAHSAHLTSRPELVRPLVLAIDIFLVRFRLCSGYGNRFWQVVFLCSMQASKLASPSGKSPADWMPTHHKPTQFYIENAEKYFTSCGYGTDLYNLVLHYSRSNSTNHL